MKESFKICLSCVFVYHHYTVLKGPKASFHTNKLIVSQWFKFIQMHLAELLLNNWWVTKSQELLGIVISESTRSGSFALRMCSVWILKGTMLTLHIVMGGKSSVRLPGQTSGTFYFSHSCSFPLHPFSFHIWDLCRSHFPKLHKRNSKWQTNINVKLHKQER